MFEMKPVARHVLLAVCGGLGVSALAPAVAQTPPQQQQLERVEVTGSMLRRVDAESALPVTQISIQDLQQAGVTNAEQAMKLITSGGASLVSSGSVSQGNGAASYASLRSLGAQRTLVLLNGKRIVSNPFSAVAVDLNTLPMAALDRIEVLSDGASSIYGTDAIAGVINFITRKTYKGVAVGGEIQIPQGRRRRGLHGQSARRIWRSRLQSLERLRRRQLPPAGPHEGHRARLHEDGVHTVARIQRSEPHDIPRQLHPGKRGQHQPDLSWLPAADVDFDASAAAARPERNDLRRGYTRLHDRRTCPGPVVHLPSRFSGARTEPQTAYAEYFFARNELSRTIAPSPEGGLTMHASPFYPGNGITPANPALNTAARSRSAGARRRSARAGEHSRTIRSVPSRVWKAWSPAGTTARARCGRSPKSSTDFIGGYGAITPLRNGMGGRAGGTLPEPVRTTDPQPAWPTCRPTR